MGRLFLYNRSNNNVDDYEIKKYHASFDKPKKPVIKEVGKFGDKDWSISIGDIDE